MSRAETREDRVPRSVLCASDWHRGDALDIQASPSVTISSCSASQPASVSQPASRRALLVPCRATPMTGRSRVGLLLGRQLATRSGGLSIARARPADLGSVLVAVGLDLVECQGGEKGKKGRRRPGPRSEVRAC